MALHNDKHSVVAVWNNAFMPHGKKWRSGKGKFNIQKPENMCQLRCRKFPPPPPPTLPGAGFKCWANRDALRTPFLFLDGLRGQGKGGQQTRKERHLKVFVSLGGVKKRSLTPKRDPNPFYFPFWRKVVKSLYSQAGRWEALFILGPERSCFFLFLPRA